MNVPPRPLVGFLVGGVQKAGTTALARYLALHPRLALPRSKEAHVFDDPEFDEGWEPERIDAAYAGHFDAPVSDRLCGDATPIYIFHPTLVRRIATYNPAMRWILLLRHPVERALSHYSMERSRGDESWPLWAALLFERWRLRGHRQDWSPTSPMRHWSYRARGDYRAQLDELRRHFPPSQVLVIQSEELRSHHARVLDRICGFLAIDPFSPPPAPLSAFESNRYRQPSWLTRGLANWCLRREVRDFRRL